MDTDDENISTLQAMGFPDISEIKRALMLAKNHLNKAVAILTNEQISLVIRKMDGPKTKIAKKTEWADWTDLKFFDWTDLKLIPTGPLFNDVIPTEMKHAVLSYLCDCGAFVAAAVCQEWRDIADRRLEGCGEVTIGDSRSLCKDFNYGCSKPAIEEMFKAAAVHKLGLPLEICQPVTQIDKKIVTEALMNVSDLIVVNDQTVDNEPILSTGQFEHFFASIEEGDKIMEEVQLLHLENLEDLNQEKLTNFLLSRVKRLTMGGTLDRVFFDVGMFLTKLLQDSSTLKLTHLTLYDIALYDYTFENPTQAADALCEVPNVKLMGSTSIHSLTDRVMERLIENILQRPIVMKTLVISLIGVMDIPPREESVGEGYTSEFYPHIDPQDLKTLFIKMESLTLEGYFTEEQLQAVGSLPDVDINSQEVEDSQDLFYTLEKFSCCAVGTLPGVDAGEERITTDELD